MTIIGVDIGGTNFRAGAVTEDGTIIKFEKTPTKSVVRSGDVLSDIAAYLKAFAEDLDYSAVAIGFPATLDPERKKVIQAPNIPFMENLPVCDYLNAELGVPVLAERDVTYALCYDMNKYHIPEEGLSCGIYFGTGIGNAISIDGRFHAGRCGAAGELGHIPVLGSSVMCGCGNIGCLEAVAGGKALVRIQQEYFPDTQIGALFTEHGDEKVLLDFIDGMAVAVATEVNILDPDHVLVGGGVMKMPDFPKEYLHECILKRVRKPLPANELNIIYTDDEKDKSVIGGAVYARRSLCMASEL
ncbi:MAG: allose kinase [Blautia sp.]|nr:allose kinase [Blautia sp.]